MSTPATAPATGRAHQTFSAAVETIDVTGTSLSLSLYFLFSLHSPSSFCPLPGSWHRNLFFNTSESGARKFGQLLEAVEVVDLVNDVDLLNAVHIANDGHLANEVHPPTADDHSFGEFVEYDS